MGNKLNKSKRPSRTSKIFLSPQSSLSSFSVTIPSVCTQPSFHLSAKKSASEASSEAFYWDQMQDLYTQQQFLTTTHLSLDVLKVTMSVFEVLKRQMGEICADIQSGTLKMPDPIGDKIANSIGMKTIHVSATNLLAIHKKSITHFAKLIYVHDLILDYLSKNKVEQALDLIKQVAVSHALLGVVPTDFRMMDWFIINYLVKYKVASDESINKLIIYLNTVSNYISKFYTTQSIRYKVTQDINVRKKNDRNNQARENFRLMKKWKSHLESFKAQEQYVEELLNELTKLQQSDEDIKSIDTLTLKEHDFIMKRFLKSKETGRISYCAQ